MNDCIIQITSQGKEKLLYLESNKGDLAHAGSEVLIVASNVLEGETEKDVESIATHLFCSPLGFTPVCQGSDDITFQYHIDITARENVIIGYHKADRENKRYKVSTFVRKVNAAKLRQPTPYTQTERLEIADTILHQMGGSGRLVAMIGMNTPTTITPDLGVIFSFRGSRKANKCRITYDSGADLYTFELLKYTPVRYSHCPVVFKAERVYFDMLQSMFEQETGLYLSF